MDYEISGTVMVEGRGELYFRSRAMTLQVALEEATHLRGLGADANISVWEHDDAREAREGGSYAPRLVDG